MLETVSVFDAMELDNTQVRVASRRALALAHTRVESHLGRFLRAAQNEAEFYERLALVIEDFDGYVTTASKEVGHDKPEHIATALKDHYRLAAQPPQFVKTPEEEEKETEEEEEEGKVARLTKKDRKALKRLAKSDRTWKIVSTEGKQGSPLAVRHSAPYQNQPYPNDKYPQPDPLDQEWDIDRPAFFDQSGQLATDPMRNQQGYIGPNVPKDIAHDEGYEQIPYQVNPEDPRTQRDYGNDRGLEIAPNLPSVSPPRGAPIRQGAHPSPGGLFPPDDEATLTEGGAFDRGFGGEQPAGPQTPTPTDVTQLSHDAMQRILDDPSLSAQAKMMYLKQWEAAQGQSPYDTSFDASNDPYAQQEQIPRHFGSNNPSDQRSNEHQQVTCPECGGDGKQAGVNRCGKCKGAGKVPNFGDSMVDAVGADIKTSENHNNTDLGGPEPKMDKAKWTPSNPGEPKVEDGLWPTKRKDVTEPIKATNESPLTEIGEKSTETKDLPANSGDAGFSGDGPGPAPHTDTFGNDGQTDPVTREALANTTHTNPLSEMLLAEFPPDTVVQAAFLEEALT